MAWDGGRGGYVHDTEGFEEGGKGRSSPRGQVWRPGETGARVAGAPVPPPSSSGYESRLSANREAAGLIHVTRALRGFPEVATKSSNVPSFPLLGVGGWG